MNNTFVLPIMMGLFVVMLFLGGAGGRDELSTFSARAGTILMIVANAYYPSRLIVRSFGALHEEADLFFKKYLKVHMVLNLLAFPAVTIHGHYAEKNVPLRVSYAVLIVLATQGLLMYHRALPDVRDRILMIRVQRTLFVVWILLVMIGHSVL